MTYASPAPISPSVPSSCATCILPDWTTPTCRTWHRSVPTTGLTHSDHFQPGSKVRRAAVLAPILTTSTRVLDGRADGRRGARSGGAAGRSAGADLDPGHRDGPDAERWRHEAAVVRDEDGR